MAIPIATTTISVGRLPVDEDRDGYDPPPSPQAAHVGVRACIDAPTAVTDLTGGDRVAYRSRLTCDPITLLPGDQVTDDNTTDTYVVDWARRRIGLIDHTVAQLRMVQGAS